MILDSTPRRICDRREEMRWSIQLHSRTKAHLKGLCRGSTPARIMIRARSLLMLAERKRVGQVADIVGCSEATVKRVRRRFLDEGWKRAVYDAPKPGRPRAVTIREEQALIALACTRPPEGVARWTIRWLAERSGHSFNPLVQHRTAGSQGRWSQTMAGKKCGASPRSMRSTNVG